MLDVTETIPVTLNAHKGMWTRSRKRLEKMERSIIDYVIMTKTIAEMTSMIYIDEAGLHKLKGKEETDHNSIIVEVALPTAPKLIKEKITNYKDSEGWVKFNQIIQNKFEKQPPNNYDDYESAIKEAISKSFKTITITKGVYKHKSSETAKLLKKKKKHARKEFVNAQKQQKLHKLQIYLNAQKELRDELEKCETERVEQRMNMIIQQGGAGSDHFWKIRKKILSQGKNDEYELITEEGDLITEPNKTKEYIADFYQKLYKAREGTPEYEHWTKLIKDKVQEVDQDELDDEPDFSTEEIKKAIKTLKRGKSNGPDQIPNEVFIECNPKTLEIHKTMMNTILQTTNIPA